MDFERTLVKALKGTAIDLEHRTGPPIRERELEDVLCAELGQRAPGVVSRQVRLDLGGWRGVGSCDLAVLSDERDALTLLELKWGQGTLYNCAWDAAKLAAALSEGAGCRAYLVAGAPDADWKSEQPGAELFESSQWSTAAFFKRYAREFAFWRGEVKTRPEILPATFSTASLCSFDIEIDARHWQLRCASVAVPGGAMLRVDAHGNTETAMDASRSIS